MPYGPDRSAGPPVKDPYEVLGVPRGAPQDEVDAAYRRLCLRYHPDKHAGADGVLQDLAEERFKEIQAAYEALSAMPRKRGAYSTAGGASVDGDTPEPDASAPPAGRTGVPGRQLLGGVLLDLGVISRDRLRVALRHQVDNPTAPRIGEVLVALEACAPDQVAKGLARQRGLPFVDLKEFRVSPPLASLIPLALATEQRLVPIRVEDGTLVGATDEPNLLDSQSSVAKALGLALQLVVAEPRLVAAALQAGRYGAGQEPRRGFWKRLFRFIEEHPEGPVEAFWDRVRPGWWPLSGILTVLVLIGLIVTVYLVQHGELGPARWLAVVPLVVAIVGYPIVRGLLSLVSRIGRK